MLDRHGLVWYHVRVANENGGETMTINTTKIELMLAERGMTRKELAAHCGISRQNISIIIRRGTAEPKTVGKLALGLGVPVANIIKEGVTQ